MKAITIWQPWASLIMIGAKPYEFRPKSYLVYRGHPLPGHRVVIHAGARPVKPSEVHTLIEACTKFSGAHTGLLVDQALPLLRRIAEASGCRGVIPEGCGLGTAIMGRPRNAATIFAGELPHDSDRGDFNWAWPMTDIEPFEAPIPMRGMQGFWDWPLKAKAA